VAIHGEAIRRVLASSVVDRAVGHALSGPLVDTVARESTRLLFALGGFLVVLWTIGYFAAFWSATGETPGNRLLPIRVRQ
jgi:hypothetical protein